MSGAPSAANFPFAIPLNKNATLLPQRVVDAMSAVIAKAIVNGDYVVTQMAQARGGRRDLVSHDEGHREIYLVVAPRNPKKSVADDETGVPLMI